MIDKRIRVLVCDDQALVRAGYATIFGAQPDMEVVGQAQDGREAVDVGRQLTPDVIVMDIRMPFLDGIEATRLLAGPGVDNPARILIVTTFNVDEYVYEALLAGASGFLLKDSPTAELVNGIRTIARGDALLAPTVTRGLIGHFADRVRPVSKEPLARLEVTQCLTRRELEVFELIATGLSNVEIAGHLFIAPETVKTYVSRILSKLNLRDRVQAVVLAHRVGLAPEASLPGT